MYKVDTLWLVYQDDHSSFATTRHHEKTAKNNGIL